MRALGAVASHRLHSYRSNALAEDIAELKEAELWAGLRQHVELDLRRLRSNTTGRGESTLDDSIAVLLGAPKPAEVGKWMTAHVAICCPSWFIFEEMFARVLLKAFSFFCGSVSLGRCGA